MAHHGSFLAASVFAKRTRAMTSSSETDAPGGPSLREKYPNDAKRVLAGFRRETVFRDRLRDSMRRDIDVSLVDRSVPDQLFDLKRKHFFHEQAEALASFLKRYGRSPWMKQQVGYREKAALAASSRSRFDGLRYCYCRPGRLCGYVDFCPRCHLEQRVRPALEEYGSVFDKADYWFAAVPSMSYSPKNAGLHFVVRKDAEGRCQEYRHFKPFGADEPERRGLTLDIADFNPLTKLLQVPFQLTRLARGLELVDGAYATREIVVQFVPQPKAPLKVGEIVLPHGNILFNSRRKPDWRFAQDCWLAYVELWAHLGLFGLGYPDLLIGRAMVDQAEINRWLSYSLKPLPFESFYRDGLRRGCPIDHLNLHFDQTVFNGIEFPLGCVRSPRKYGTLNGDPRTGNYMGARPVNRTLARIKKKIAKTLKHDPDADPLDRLARTEIDFLRKHGGVLAGLVMPQELGPEHEY
jgi:hypothetical protein